MLTAGVFQITVDFYIQSAHIPFPDILTDSENLLGALKQVDNRLWLRVQISALKYEY